jgi:tetratricopeptide (TPR) repeat protein
VSSEPALPPAAASPAAEDSVDSFLREAAGIPDPATGEAASPVRLREREVLGGRFFVERLAGRGGMGAVYKALDRMTGAPVALKVIGRRRDDERFAREARVLSELTHPAIVRYVAHGSTAEGLPFLAMEWLDGENLADRLTRCPLGVSDSLAVARRVAEGLGAVHDCNVVHRDVKPSNVLLVGRDPSRTKLLDFGIVRLGLSALSSMARPMTDTGMIIGTVGYMSPEQATADPSLDARSDVFALGCVLFECLTGEPAFSGAHVVAVLAKVLREEAPRVRQLRPELPAALDELVARMLSKDRARRPANGAAVVRELAALGPMSDSVPEAGARPSAALSGGEQRLVSVMLGIVPDEPQRIAEIVRRHGGTQARLANGALLVTLDGGSTSEHVLIAASCALELHAAFPSVRVALAVGRAQTVSGAPVGIVIDQAAALLAESTSAGIRIDEVSAALIGGRFETHREGLTHVLLGRRSDTEPPRTLLGKPTPCVGRDKELALLEHTLRECVEESVARRVLVTGPPGQGKSRLQYEFVARARQRGDIAVLTARADPVGAGSAFVLVRQLVRQAVGLREADPAVEQHARLRAVVADRCEPADSARIADFLGELLGVPSTDRPTPQLLAARNEPRIMGEWLRRSFVEWLAAECAARPLLVVLEDLHWGDQPSDTYLGEGLRALSDRPLMLLGLARPEVHEAFPSLWGTTEKIEIALSKLVPRAAERLVRSSLGDALSAQTIARIVQRAEGNAFYLEELIRRVSEGAGDTLPETILALVESRLERLEPEARRIARAGSIFGEVFWRGAVAELIGGAAGVADLDGWLSSLVERELFTVRSESRFPGEREYVFRHGLIRDAAYAALTDSDRGAGHKIAGEWLERAGEKDALIMVDHFEKGGEPQRAVPWILRAAESAYEGGSVTAARALADRGVLHARDEWFGMLATMQGVCAGAQNDMGKALPALREAMKLVPRGGRHWFVAATHLAFLGAMAGSPAAATMELAQGIADLPPVGVRGGLYAWSAARVVHSLLFVGQPDRAKGFLQRMETAGPEEDPSFAGWLRLSRVYWNFYGVTGDLAAVVSNARQAVAAFEQAGDPIALVHARLWQSLAAFSIGSHDEVEDAVARGLTSVRQSGHSWVAPLLELSLWLDRMHTRDPRECLEPLGQLAKAPVVNVAVQAACGLSLARLRSGDAAGAETAAREALERSSQHGLTTAEYLAHSILARTLLTLGRPEACLEAVERAVALPTKNLDATALDLSAAEALMSLGRSDDGRAALREARARVLRTAARLEEADRRSYLDGVEDNVRIFARASEWLGEL